jgi:hypothetical protein
MRYADRSSTYRDSAPDQFPKWFVGGKLNLSHNAVFRHLRGPLRDRTAIIWEGEDGAVVRLTYAELAQRIGRAANALKRLGVGKGDRVGLFMPMIPETAIAALAVAHIGVIERGHFYPGYGGVEPAWLDRTEHRASEESARDLGTARVINDGAAPLAEQPHVRFGIPYLAGRAEDAQ